MRQPVAWLAIGRVIFGLILLFAPRLLLRLWWRRSEADHASTRTLARAFGAREVVLGSGTLLALPNRHAARGWLRACAAADIADAAIALLDARAMPWRGRLLYFTGFPLAVIEARIAAGLK